ncbi:hypothetical protein L1987_05356 [Smallanthus sonchifolius]|uniref:Uncharacterized protein n=1 Tax=Smallanthus sonchifolius TaxID=185202 RepID=A0ACB9JV54_9ASTR|nr:hypothetical protein L1987_05356 [Smallanthus sonchifolius]
MTMESNVLLLCANIYRAKQQKGNIYNTNKLVVNEGGVRGGRAGGYKKLDEEEFEETKRRRWESKEVALQLEFCSKSDCKGCMVTF